MGNALGASTLTSSLIKSEHVQADYFFTVLFSWCYAIYLIVYIYLIIYIYFCLWAFFIAQLVKNLPAMQETWFWKICWRRERLPTPVFLVFPCGSAGKKSACNEGDLGSIPGSGRSPGEGKGYPLQYSGLENSMDYIYIVHGVAKSWTQLSDFHFSLLPSYFF